VLNDWEDKLPPRSAMSLASTSSHHLCEPQVGMHLAPSADDLDLRDLDGNVLLANASPAVRRSIRHLSSAASLSAASLARSVLEGLGASDMDCLQQTRLFVLQKEFAVLYKSQRQERAGMFFTLPVFLLFLRLTINLLFTSMYRLWCKTKDGIETLEQVELLLQELLSSTCILPQVVPCMDIHTYICVQWTNQVLEMP
jgi:hypothetical protein